MPIADWLLIRFETVDSTMDIAKTLAEFSFSRTVVIVAMRQKKGRGRGNRKWLSPEGGLWLSIIFEKKDIGAFTPQLLLFAIALSIINVLKSYKVDATMKWPNDVYVGDKKIAGILAETTIIGGEIKNVIVGIGININNDLSNTELKNRATSLRALTGKKIKLENFLTKLIHTIDTVLENTKQNTTKILRQIESVFYLKGKKIEIHYNNMKITGKCLGLNRKGNLIIETENKATKIEIPNNIDKVEIIE